jgi:rhodanese-related sulfurtransferase
MLEHGTMGADYFITSPKLYERIVGLAPPLVLDACRAEICVERGTLIPTARRIDHGDGPALAATLPRDRPIVVACAHGHNRSQRVAAWLRRAGLAASVLDGGYDSWTAAGLPLVRLEAKGVRLGLAPTTWVTRRRPKIDRVACPWLIRRFLDDRANFLFVDPDEVVTVAETEGGIAYDLPGAPFEHEGPLCTFDILLRDFGLAGDPALARLATIVRGADTDRLDLAPQCAGLLAASLGLSALAGDDDATMVARGATLYDGLFAYIRQASDETHNWKRAG